MHIGDDADDADIFLAAEIDEAAQSVLIGKEEVCGFLV